MIQLERAKHLLELSSVDQPASHNAIAARHLQSAIHELKLELQENAKGKAAASAGQNLSANNKVTQRALAGSSFGAAAWWRERTSECHAAST